MSDELEGPTEEKVVELLVEEASLRIYAAKLTFQTLVRSNKMYIIANGLTESDIVRELKANFTTLNWIMDQVDSEVYIDYGYNRQKLTRPLLSKLVDL